MENAAENKIEKIMERELLKCSEAKQAIEILWAAGHEAYFVGGCVRDSLLGITPEDLDITTDALPEQTKSIFKDRGYAVIETGMKHGTVTVLIESMPLEITTYRVDGGYTDHRRPDRVKFTGSLEEDLARRDFTVNALAWSPGRGLVDAFSGREDLEAGMLRCVGVPVLRFREDALRILRALRFSAKYGFQIEEATEKALFTEKSLLRKVSAERVFSELKKLLAGKEAATVLIRYVDILAEVLPELLPMKNFQQNNPHHSYDVWTHSVLALESLSRVGQGAEIGAALRLAALFHDVGKPSTYSEDQNGVGHFYRHGAVGRELAEGILTRMKADGATKERVLTLIKYHDVGIGEDRRGIKRWLSRLGPEVLSELLLLKRADNMAQNRARFDRQPQYRRMQSTMAELITEGECFSLKALAVDGRDLMEAGIEEGPEIGTLLSLLLAAVIDGKSENDKESLLDYLRRNKRLVAAERRSGNLPSIDCID